MVFLGTYHTYFLRVVEFGVSGELGWISLPRERGSIKNLWRDPPSQRRPECRATQLQRSLLWYARLQFV